MIRNLLTSLVLLLAIACSSESSNETDEVLGSQDNVNIPASVEDIINEMLGSGDKTIRGFDLGDSISTVKTYENLEQFEETQELLGYTFEISEFEIVDVLYLHDASDVINEVQLDIYLDSDSTSNEIIDALSLHFTQKYGKPVLEKNQNTWSINALDKVTIEDITSTLDRGLQVRFKRSL
ncbi:hypothetical protein [Arcticibacterium luteifluviistationis]|uniref:Lipoprotein n=1 Tax=Arcticibacterium luteifluviistationis TaxID=1784714 RepID=A0A2Z4G9J6_9BACT|nr:hypothetical protein [Arcticibacterium luteifluviistationis]AWV97856.1 hypothetical protein DJ013_06610 [Arcticibacterium luteifluviistationis]